MFIKNNDSGLIFIKSKNINVFPCGRRRSNLIDADGNEDTVSDKYYIPFDPEARLNTEANNRKYSSLNGFKQSYLRRWASTLSDGTLEIVLGGYLFKINLDYGYHTPSLFGTALENANYINNANSIYANIKLANVKFFSGTASVPEATTEVLRDQVLNDEPATCLDFIIDTYVDKSNPDSYFFSGLSLTSWDASRREDNVISLRILTKVNDVWELYNPSKLPKVEHGDTIDSVKIPGDLYLSATESATGSITAEGNITTNSTVFAASVEAKQLIQNGHTAVLLDVNTSAQTDGTISYQLRFTGAIETQ